MPSTTWSASPRSSVIWPRSSRRTRCGTASCRTRAWAFWLRGRTTRDSPTYLLIGGRSALDLKPDLDRAAPRLERVATVSVPQSSLVLLDELPAWGTRRHAEAPMNDIEIYYLKADR